MAQRGLVMGLAVVLLATVWIGTSAQSNSGCTSAIVSLSPCLGYITGNETTPSSSCCTQLATVVQSEPQCLCMVLNGTASSMGLTINTTQALALPGACKVQTPPVSQCKSSGSAPSPGSSAPSGGGSKTVPSTSSYDGNLLQIPFTLIFSLVIIVASSWTSLWTF